MTAKAIFDDHGALQGLGDDDHAQYLLLAGRAGGQTAIGGTAAGEELNLRGSSNANLGQIRLQSPIDFDDTLAANALNPYFVQANPTQTIPAAFIGGGANYSPTITFSNGLFIWEGMRIAPNITSGVAPAFAAFTLLNALPVLRSNTAAFSPLNALTLNVGVTIENFGVGVATTTATNFGVSFSPQARVTGAFSTVNVTNQTAVSCRPTFSTINTSVANLGTIRGLHCQQPAVALFQPAAGTENMTAYVGLDMDVMTFGGNVTKVAVRSALAAATNTYFLQNTGTARSSFGSSNIEFNDLFGVLLGNSQDVGIGWGAAGFLFFNFTTGNLGQIRISSELEGNTTDRYLIQGIVQSSEFNINCDRFSLGAQSGSVGNGVGAFVTPTRTTAVNGGWADFNLTHAGNITIDDTMSEVVAWNINALSLTSGSGSITGHVASFQVGGMTTSSLGGAETHALRITGRTTTRGVMAHEPLETAALTANVNDFSPATGNADRQWWLLTSDDLGARTITGISIQQQDDSHWISNVGTVDNIILSHQNVGSAASNRFISPTGADLTLGPDESAFVAHDRITDRWRILFHTGA